METFAKLPGPVQQAMPFVTIGATVAIGMKMWGDRALFAEVLAFTPPLLCLGLLTCQGLCPQLFSSAPSHVSKSAGRQGKGWSAHGAQRNCKGGGDQGHAMFIDAVPFFLLFRK